MTVLDNVTLAPRKVLGVSRSDSELGAGNCWNGSVWRTKQRTTRTDCRVDSSSASRSCGRWR